MPRGIRRFVPRRSKPSVGGHKCDAAGSDLQEVLRDKVTGATIVDSNEVVAAAMRIRKIAAVQQHHGDACLIESNSDPPVCLGILRSELQRREKHPGYSPLNILLAETPSLLISRWTLLGIAPKQGVASTLRGIGHPLAHRLENVRLAEIGYQ